MQTPTNSHENFDSVRHVRLSGVGDLVAAVPAMLGFHPHRSMVLIGLGPGGESVGPTMRHDLDLAGHDVERRGGADTRATSEMLEVIDFLAGYCSLEGMTAVVAVFVDDRVRRGSDDVYGRDIESVAAELRFALDSSGVLLATAVATADVAQGEQWRSLLGTRRTGMVSDPTSSPLTMARVLEGRTVRGSRSELCDTIAPDACASRGAVSEQMRRLRRDGGRTHAEELETVLAAIARHADGTDFADGEVARVGVAIGHIQVRDALLALVLGDDAAEVEQFWTVMTRRLPDTERAIAATMLAFSAYARGDGPMARVAVDVALDCDETYSLAGLMERSLASGAKPDLIREVAAGGYDCARACGVVLPGDGRHRSGGDDRQWR